MSVKPGFGGSPLSCSFPSLPSYLQQAHQFFLQNGSHMQTSLTLWRMPPLFSGQARLSSQPCRGCARLFLGGPQWPPHPQGGTDLPLCCPVISDDNLPLPPGGPLASFCQLNLSTQTARMVRKQNRGLRWGVWTEGVTAGAHPSQGSALNRGPAGRC